MTITQDELEAWQKYIIGKPCPKHPQNIVKESKFGGVWCAAKDFQGYCRVGFPTEEWLNNLRKHE